MNCPDCGYLIPEGQLNCLSCLEKRAWKGALESARPFAPHIRDSRLTLRVMKKFTSPKHIQIPNHYGSWCGIDMRGFTALKDRYTLEAACQLPAICTACLSALTQFIEDNCGIPTA